MFREETVLRLIGAPTVFFYLFTLSGFAGLIYESIWTHYLKLFLGHAAYAQTLVLGIFMGGMALGSWVCARWGQRWRRLILGYAIVEGLIGLLALIFHDIFTTAVSHAYDVILPALGAPLAISAYKWAASALLILPQSVLLGMTFPLLSAGVIRRFPDTSGGIIATLYFSNSIGAAVGVLASGFLLIDWFGLPGTLRTAGALNLLVAALAGYLQTRAAEPPAAPRPAAASQRAAGNARLLLAIALLTGGASFIYEIAWIRMLSLVMGSATHSFELMLSAFILGLALGGWWIRRRIQRIGNLLAFLAAVQVVMGLLAAATLLLYNQTFDIMHWLMQTVGKSYAGYLWFNTVGHGIALAVMLPATICAGMTLPLLTYTLLDRGHGEAAIGGVYAANTVGAITGVFFAVHLGLPLLGIKWLLAAGAAIDIALGFGLWWHLQRHTGRRFPVRGALATSVVLALILTSAQPDGLRMASGTYREGQMLSATDDQLLFHRDGKTASIDVIQHASDLRAIRTNGKTDAAIYSGPLPIFGGDEPTMVLAALSPLAYIYQPRSAAVIGFGSGLSTHAMLASGSIQRVDTVEIEQAMVEGARHFMFRVARAYEDPRSHLHIDDAKTFFSSRQQRYDIILSEPSNPWVSGVAGLFTTEFYQHVSRHLSDDGIFVQWLQLYEIDSKIVASITRALESVFDDYVVLTPNNIDMLLLARRHGEFAAPSPRLFIDPGVREELAKIGIHHLRDFELRLIGNKKLLHEVLAGPAAPANSDYHPYVDLHAVQARFLRAGVSDALGVRRFPVPVLTLLTGQPRTSMDPISDFPFLDITGDTARADKITALLRGDSVADMPAELEVYASDAGRLLTGCQPSMDNVYWVDSLFNTVAMGVLPYASPPPLQQILGAASARACPGQAPPQLAWLRLLRAIAVADNKDIVRVSREILERHYTYSDRQYAYVVFAALAALVSEGEVDDARQLWHGYGTDVMPVFRDQAAVKRMLLGSEFTAAESDGY